jgi:hypothetical protein
MHSMLFNPQFLQMAKSNLPPSWALGCKRKHESALGLGFVGEKQDATHQ